MQEVSGSIPLTSTNAADGRANGNIGKGREYGQILSPSSRGLGHHPFTVSTGVRIPLGTPALSGIVPGSICNGAATRSLLYQRAQERNMQHGQFMSPSSRGLGHHPFTVSTGVRIPLGTPVKSRSRPTRMRIGAPVFLRPRAGGEPYHLVEVAYVHLPHNILPRGRQLR